MASGVSVDLDLSEDPFQKNGGPSKGRRASTETSVLWFAGMGTDQRGPEETTVPTSRAQRESEVGSCSPGAREWGVWGYSCRRCGGKEPSHQEVSGGLRVEASSTHQRIGGPRRPHGMWASSTVPCSLLQGGRSPEPQLRFLQVHMAGLGM